jgi:hypothetical protein
MFVIVGQQFGGQGGAETRNDVGGQPVGVITFSKPVYGKPAGL